MTEAYSDGKKGDLKTGNSTKQDNVPKSVKVQSPLEYLLAN